MSTAGEQERKERMADAVRQVVTRRERAPRSPRLERALKRLIWRYTGDREPGREGEGAERPPGQAPGGE